MGMTADHCPYCEQLYGCIKDLRRELASATRHMELAEAAWLRETAGNSPKAIVLSGAERQAIERQANWMAKMAQEAGDIHSADLRLQEAADLRGLLERTK